MKQNFTNKALYKQNEVIMKQNKEIFECLSTLVRQNQKENDLNSDDTYKKLSLYENKITSLNASVAGSLMIYEVVRTRLAAVTLNN